MERVFGFEILPAPFVVSHLQLGLLLQNIGAPLGEKGDERAGVYLTNALTGWEPPSEAVKVRLQQLAFSFAELRAEYDAAERVKQEVPILVILGIRHTTPSQAPVQKRNRGWLKLTKQD